MQRVGFLALIRRFICPIQPAKGIAQVSVAGEFETKPACLPHHAGADPGILLKLLADCGGHGLQFEGERVRSVHAARAGHESKYLVGAVPGSESKNARLFTRGQFPASPANAAAHAFICSEMAGSFGRRFLSFKDAWP